MSTKCDLSALTKALPADPNGFYVKEMISQRPIGVQKNLNDLTLDNSISNSIVGRHGPYPPNNDYVNSNAALNRNKGQITQPEIKEPVMTSTINSNQRDEKKPGAPNKREDAVGAAAPPNIHDIDASNNFAVLMVLGIVFLCYIMMR